MENLYYIYCLKHLQLSYMVHPRGYEFRRYCWLSIQKGMLVSYLVPVAFLITVRNLYLLKEFN